ncbi:E3 ubiquitin-protein ligase TRIM68-like [Gouania willdenowi]|uniref:E3 ubiquitin-protein ligase TRIM68-like n=1 Tax=Gouania willdenowi TaxID=441366 RepID=UPI00105466EC|nr:E3 ubiquitin-protein ligase TRIM68-like [Gouania willdenowi]
MSQPAVLLTAFTGTAAFNIEDKTLHSVLKLPRSLELPYQGQGLSIDFDEKKICANPAITSALQQMRSASFKSVTPLLHHTEVDLRGYTVFDHCRRASYGTCADMAAKRKRRSRRREQMKEKPKKEKPKKTGEAEETEAEEEKQMKEKPKKEKQKKQEKKKQEKEKQSPHHCGHNFCKSCISTHWDTSVSYTCPVCKKEFTTRPPIAVNNLVSQMVSVLRRELAAPEEVSKVKAVRSCQDIETYLTEPVQNLETKMCLKHSEPLDMFCKTDQTCVCSTCCDSEHSGHVFVSLEKESGERVEELQQMIQERQEYKKEIMKLMNTADSQKGEGVELSTAVNELVQRCLTMLTETVKEQQISKKGEADAVIKELVDEYFELMKRKYEAEQLFRPEDRFQLFQHVHSPLPATKDYTEVIVHLSSYEETALTVAAQMKDQIRDKLKMKRMKQFAVDVTFDPLTAYNKLNLSDDRKQVHMSDVKNNVPDNPERFYPCANVLGKQSFSSGKFYYEVLVEGKN